MIADNANTAFTITKSSGLAVGIGTSSPWRTFAVSGTVGLANLTTNTGGVTSALCLDSNNQVTRNTDNETCVASSERYKENIQDLAPEMGLALINQLRPVTFEFKTATGTTRFGFIAEEVNAIDPRLVSFNDEGLPQSVRYIEVIPHVVDALQEIDARFLAIASSTASTTPASAAFAASFFDSILARVGSWLSDANNGLNNIFGNNIYAKEKICVDDQCLTKSDIKSLLQLINSSGAPAASSSGGGGAPAPEPIPAPEGNAGTTTFDGVSTQTPPPDTSATEQVPSPESSSPSGESTSEVMLPADNPPVSEPPSMLIEEIPV